MATDIGELLVKLSADLKNLDSGLKTAKGELAGFQDYASSFAATLKKTLAFAGVAVGIYEIASAVKSVRPRRGYGRGPHRDLGHIHVSGGQEC